MTPSQIYDMDVVSDSCTIRGWIVITEHRKLVKLADQHLGDIGRQIIRDAIGIFTNLTAKMSTHRVEIAQQGNIELRVGPIDVAQDLLGHQFGAPVRVGTKKRRLLRNGAVFRITIDGGRRAEDKIMNALLKHHFGQHQG